MEEGATGVRKWFKLYLTHIEFYATIVIITGNTKIKLNLEEIEKIEKIKKKIEKDILKDRLKYRLKYIAEYEGDYRMRC